MSWEYWIIIGLVLVVAEIALPGFLFLALGSGFVLTGLMTMVATMPLTLQLGIATVATAISFALYYRLLGRRSKDVVDQGVGQAQEEAVGVRGVMLSPCAPHDEGWARFERAVIGDRQWRVRCDLPLQEGDEIEIVEITGNSAIVKPIAKER
ncbi:MAG: NfeD family protein [Campylobacterales bacterium]